MKKGVCFVIMGYGVKVDYSTGRQLDLDKTYRNIIKPAAEEAGLECIRADEIRHSGVIDVPMYNYLVTADVAIADLSTYNPNAFYELGVRHALRPHTTIAIAEKELKKPFDVDHTVIRYYEHLGKDIGYEEVLRFRSELRSVIEDILKQPSTDSPVYTYLAGLEPPVWKNGQEVYNETKKNSLSSIIEAANCAMDTNNFTAAIELFKLALKIDENSTYVIQRLTLATYKSKHPSQLDALHTALGFLSALNLENSTDPETLGLAGAINKRLWEETSSLEYLNKSIYYYEKGFYILNDYYNGINLAYLLNLRAFISTGDDKIADNALANRVRVKVIEICNMLRAKDFESRGDKYWILATLEEAWFGLADELQYKKYKLEAERAAKQNWERQTTEEQIAKLRSVMISSALENC